MKKLFILDASPAPPPSVNAWEKPITHSLRSHSPAVTSNSSVASITSTIVSSCSSVIPTDVQVLASTSKSSSFDRSDQHDSGIDVSDQPASAASSQRSSPSNDCKIITPTSSGKSTSSNEVSDLVSFCFTKLNLVLNLYCLVLFLDIGTLSEPVVFTV